MDNPFIDVEVKDSSGATRKISGADFRNTLLQFEKDGLIALAGSGAVCVNYPDGFLNLDKTWGPEEDASKLLRDYVIGEEQAVSVELERWGTIISLIFQASGITIVDWSEIKFVDRARRVLDLVPLQEKVHASLTAALGPYSIKT